MIDFDATRTFQPILEKIAKTTNPRHVKMLKMLLQHAKGEVEGDLEAVLGSLAPYPIYKYVRKGGLVPQPEGYDQIRAFYIDEIFGAGRNFLEGNKDRIVVDDDTIITEGTMRLFRWGRDLANDGLTVDDENATYLMVARLLIVWPFDEECRIIGEESWSQRAGSSLTKLADEDVPEVFKAYIKGRLAKAA